MIKGMTLVKINAITVPADSGDELAQRFAARAGAVDDQDGFEGFELLKPVDDRTTWLVVTRWRDEESFQAWLSSPSFAHGHRLGQRASRRRRARSRSACTASCGRTRSPAAPPKPDKRNVIGHDRSMAEPTDPWNSPSFLRDVQYRTDENLTARQSIYVYQHPRLDLQARVIDLAAPAPGATVADVGCGNGAYLAELARRGLAGRVLGLDMSPGMLAAARDRLTTVGPPGAPARSGQPARPTRPLRRLRPRRRPRPAGWR